MNSFLRRLEILNFLRKRFDARLGAAGTDVILQHLFETGYLESPNDTPSKSDYRLLQRDMNFLLGEVDEEGEHDNPFGMHVARGDGKSRLWTLEPYQHLRYDFERMPSFMALALSLTQKHLKQVLPAAVQRELFHLFSSAQLSLERQEKKLSPSHYMRLTEAVAFYQRGQSLKPPEFNMQILDRIYQAILVGKRISISYRSGTSAKEYELHPYGVVIMLPKIYLLAKKEDVQTPQSELPFRSFLVHKIGEVELGNQSNRVPSDFSLKEYLEAGNMDVLLQHNDDARYLLQLELTPEPHSNLIQDLRESPISASQVLRQIDAQTWVLEAEVKRTIQLRNWLLSLGAQAHVLAPEQIRQDLVTHLENMQARYQPKLQS